MILKRSAGFAALIIAGCIGLSPQAGASGQLQNTVTYEGAAYRVVEGGDFKVATLQSDRLLETYRLSKYDVLDIQLIGFPEGAGMNDIMVGPD